MKALGFNDKKKSRGLWRHGQSYRQMASVQWPINKNHVICAVMAMEEYPYNGGLKRYLINVLVSVSILKVSIFNMWVKKKDSFVVLFNFFLGFYRQYISQSRFFHRCLSCHAQCNRLLYRQKWSCYFRRLSPVKQVSFVGSLPLNPASRKPCR